MPRLLSFVLLLIALPALAAEPAKVDPREALKPFQGFVAPWKGVGVPEGTRAEREKFWTEMVTWEWRFDKGSATLVAKFEGGRYFTQVELRPLGNDRFRLTADTVAKEKLDFEGNFKDGRLNLERVDEKTKETQRLSFRLLHANRVVYQYETRADGKTMFVVKYKVGLTSQNEPFANSGSNDPECVVSGGKGTIAVSHKGKTYYVCCTGCRDEFKADPDKYIAEFEAKKKEKK